MLVKYGRDIKKPAGLHPLPTTVYTETEKEVKIPTVAFESMLHCSNGDLYVLYEEEDALSKIAILYVWGKSNHAFACMCTTQSTMSMKKSS